MKIGGMRTDGIPKEGERKFSTDEIFKKVDSSLNRADQMRSENLQRLMNIQQIKAKTLEREKQRLSAKYGAEHPRVVRLDSKLRFNEGFVKDLKVEIDRAKVEVPTLDKKAWMVHGRILNEDKAGIKGLTVSLSGKDKKWVKQLGYACTNELGYFAITYSAKKGEDSAKKREELKISKSQELFLTVTDQDQNVCHRETDPLRIAIGRIDYREIILPEEGKVCTPPESHEVYPPSRPCKDDTSAPPNAWVLRGKVRDEKGKAAGGLVVSPYDKDLVFDDALGTTVTDDDGSFSITYEAESYPDLFEKKPEIYLKVMDENKENTLYTSDRPVMSEVGRAEVHNIEIKPKTKREERAISPDEWVVWGQVTNEKELGISGLTVSVYDKDMAFDERLGTTTTDEEGYFIASYPAKDFPDLIEANPDLYVKILDEEGNELHSSKEPVKYELGRAELLNVTIREKGKSETEAEGRKRTGRR